MFVAPIRKDGVKVTRPLNSNPVPAGMCRDSLQSLTRCVSQLFYVIDSMNGQRLETESCFRKGFAGTWGLPRGEVHGLHDGGKS